MGIYSEYIGHNFTFEQINHERKGMLQLISHLRGRDVLVYAADYTKGDAPISISFEDLLPIHFLFYLFHALN